ncbi:MAG: hypothetical protein ACOCXT_00450 [Candidatus Dojkabacteria bacterium]
MAKNKTEKPFNLLYKFEPQKSGIDKLYDFVMMQGRMIVVFVMLIIIVAFVFRFPLDRQLNNEIKRAEKNVQRLEYYEGEIENGFRDTLARTESARKYLDTYPREEEAPVVGLAEDEKTGQIEVYRILEKALEIKEEFDEDIVLYEYSYESDPALEGQSMLTISGLASTNQIAEKFRDTIREEKKLVRAITMSSRSADEGFAINLVITVKKP